MDLQVGGEESATCGVLGDGPTVRGSLGVARGGGGSGGSLGFRV